ncbi:MAG: hypothetical protein ACNA8W_19040 [Bradymonadaceae bacterium]
MTRTIIILLILVGLAILTGCPDDDLCHNDHDCESAQVCEPEGCRAACERHQDCVAPRLCLDRLVEEGKACKTE